MRTNAEKNTKTDPVIIISSHEAMQRCIEELIYEAVYQILVMKNPDVLDTQWDMEKRIAIAKLLVLIPDESPDEPDGLNHRPPRGWKLKPDPINQEYADMPTVTDTQKPLAPNVQLDKMFDDLRRQLNEPTQNPSVSELMIHRIASNSISQTVVESGLMKISDFWRLVRKKIDETISC